MSENRTIVAALILLLATTTAATITYHLVEGWPLLDAVYMAVITLSTVGFGEVRPLSETGKFATLFFIIAGILSVSFLVAGVSRMLLEGELRRVMGRRRMERDIKRLRDHYVVCGYGRVGRVVCSELADDGVDLVVVDRDDEIIRRAEEDGHLGVVGDATEEAVLEAVGVEHSAGLILTLPDEAANVYVSLIARDLYPDVFVIARSVSDGGERRLRAAGADRVVAPNIIGGHRIAQSVLRPQVVEFVDIVTRRKALAELQLEELRVGPGSRLRGRSIMDCDIRGRYGLMVVGLLRPDGDLLFNPSPHDMIDEGTTLIVLGRHEDLERFEDAL